MGLRSYQQLALQPKSGNTLECELRWERTYVSPVLRLTPARKAEKRKASKVKWARRPSWMGFVSGGAMVGWWRLRGEGRWCPTRRTTILALLFFSFDRIYQVMLHGFVRRNAIRCSGGECLFGGDSFGIVKVCCDAMRCETTRCCRGRWLTLSRRVSRLVFRSPLSPLYQ